MTLSKVLFSFVQNFKPNQQIKAFSLYKFPSQSKQTQDQFFFFIYFKIKLYSLKNSLNTLLVYSFVSKLQLGFTFHWNCSCKTTSHFFVIFTDLALKLTSQSMPSLNFSCAAAVLLHMFFFIPCTINIFKELPLGHFPFSWHLSLKILPIVFTGYPSTSSLWTSSDGCIYAPSCLLFSSISTVH